MVSALRLRFAKSTSTWHSPLRFSSKALWRNKMSNVAAKGAFRLADVFTKALTIYGRRFGTFIVLTVIAQIPLYLAVFAIGQPQPSSPGAFSATSASVFAASFLL